MYVSPAGKITGIPTSGPERPDLSQSLVPAWSLLQASYYDE